MLGLFNIKSVVFLLLTVSLVLSEEIGFKNDLKELPLEMTYPERLDSVNRHKRDLSTYNKESGGHDNKALFRLNAFKKTFVLDTKLNENLMSPNFAVRYFNKDGSETVEREKRSNCQYTGHVRGNPKSTVILNTCDGLSGLIDDGHESYYIEPVKEEKDEGAHKVYPARQEDEQIGPHNCGTSVKRDNLSQDNEQMLEVADTPLHRFRRDVDEIYKPYLTTDKTRYNEVFFVADYRMYLAHNNDTKRITDRVIVLANAVDAIYQRINIRIIMVGLEIWSNGDRIPRSQTAGHDLGNFRYYRNKYLRQAFPHDNTHFLSAWIWPGILGVAYLRTACSPSFVGINRWYGDILGPYHTVAHEMGHNFAMNHPSGNCRCLTRRGCIMGGLVTRVPGFTNCSVSQIRHINDWCLYNIPSKIMNAECGNGIREGNEECDCGTPEMCKSDPCCEPYQCKLKRHAQCSDLHHDCCKDCLFKKQGMLCRATRSDCDVPEYCTGDSRDCPTDSFIKNGFPCNRTNTLIVGNTNRDTITRRALSPRIQTRYIRINPQYWRGRICLRAELYGCSANEGNPTKPTPLSAFGGFCMQPKNGTCNPPDDTFLIVKPQNGETCKESFKQFRLDSKGRLRHHCSGKKVCPKGGSTKKRTVIVISSKCLDEDSEFVRTPENSLKHVKSGKCIHPNGGRPRDNGEWILWGSCGPERISIWFMNPDCFVPLGLQSGKITNKRISASSTFGDYEPEHARLLNRSWCASTIDKKQFLQIDLGKVVTVSYVATQGSSNQNNWVTGYYMYYSSDGQRWSSYSTSGDASHSNSMCYQGKCAETRKTQCTDLWGPTAQDGAKECYNKLNTDGAGYGTCHPEMSFPCAAKDVLCGQLQCEDSRHSPLIDYGANYTKITLDSGVQCSAAMLKHGDSVGRGMVESGTKCGAQKMCVNNKCQDLTILNITKCPLVDGKECGGKGVCTNTGECHCDAAYDPLSGCTTPLVARDGNWGEWSSWTECTRGCNEGSRSRHRFCNNPFPTHGGKDCEGIRIQKEKCNTQKCPAAHSCRHLQSIGKATDHHYPDGQYKIYPGNSKRPILVYCDMSRDGGGWTLLVTSHTNTWTADNVKLRNPSSPRVDDDYSILSYADRIKDYLRVNGTTFEYRLEAQKFGRWGGIWKAPRFYSFTSTNNRQSHVTLVTKFDNWHYGDASIERRMPWISGAILTTSWSSSYSWWGSITGNSHWYHPAPWIGSGREVERHPQFIWYWMREGPYQVPRSCMEIRLRGLQLKQETKDGKYSIHPAGTSEVKTYCDMTRNGGAWTLLVTSASKSGWSKDNIKLKNENTPSLQTDYSILGLADSVKDSDSSQETFQYRIEADGKDRWGGIWKAPLHYSFVSTTDKQTKIKLVQQFDNWNTSGNLGVRMPRLDLSPDVLMSSASSLDDLSGSIVYNSGGKRTPIYIKGSKEAPATIRVWMREGTRRSCNDIKVHGVMAGREYTDGYYMINPAKPANYLPVFCDMTSDEGAFTLLVTSANGNWTRNEVPLRNTMQPSLSKDYSILAYGDFIKNLSNNETFKYKLDAGQRNHWGGIFAAPRSYSFMATNNKQTGVALVKKFNNWQFLWYMGLSLRMPWFDKYGTHDRALLTTSWNAGHFYSTGSIIYGNMAHNPAKWMYYGGMINPGTIWYWVNEDDCDSDRKPVNGDFGQWTKWGKCNKECDRTATESRSRPCSEPKPRCGGRDCVGDATEERPCYFCPPVAHSCRHLQQLGLKNNKTYSDGVYRIDPEGKNTPFRAHCDMSRDNGGWTLLVSSHTNTWTSDNVLLRNKDSPQLNNDYSILKFANAIKDDPKVQGTHFEYRLEANGPEAFPNKTSSGGVANQNAEQRLADYSGFIYLDQWGGIWKAPRSYTFTSKVNSQTGVQLIRKFNNWNYNDNSIEQRMPWVSGARLTTSKSSTRRWWGSITGNHKKYKPAPWINRLMAKPKGIWYWMREGPYKEDAS